MDLLLKPCFQGELAMVMTPLKIHSHGLKIISKHSLAPALSIREVDK
jgi:hypothetical protein